MFNTDICKSNYSFPPELLARTLCPATQKEWSNCRNAGRGRQGSHMLTACELARAGWTAGGRGTPVRYRGPSWERVPGRFDCGAGFLVNRSRRIRRASSSVRSQEVHSVHSGPFRSRSVTRIGIERNWACSEFKVGPHRAQHVPEQVRCKTPTKG